MSSHSKSLRVSVQFLMEPSEQAELQGLSSIRQSAIFTERKRQ